jgi:aminoglycoside phosphotransferase (APT) family kinase protein
VIAEADVDQYLDTTRPAREGEQLDLARLEPYLRAHLPDAPGPLTVEQFPHGFSNLTYLVRLGEREFVLRRPPFGNQVKSAHDMGREYRVLSKLAKVYPPAPMPYCYCEDESILGAPFYVMERRRGVVLRKALPAGLTLDPPTVRRLSEAFLDNLALLHGIDYQAAGLGDLGKPAGYVERQVTGWTQRWEKARTEEVPSMAQLGRWLAQNLPPESGAALIHNDYKYDNLLLDAGDLTRIVAVLDWEMATTGDPLMDLGTTLAYWVEAGDSPILQAFVFGPTNVPGSLTRRELVERYGARTGRDVTGILFYYCFGLFKTAVIIQQIYARYVRGFTKDARFARLNEVVTNLSQAAVQAINAGLM